MAWLQQSSLRRNRSVRPCLLLYLHRVHTMLLLKMPVDEAKRPAATPLKRVGPFEVLPLPQQTAAKTPQRLVKCCCRNSLRFPAATHSGREPKSQNNPSRSTEPRPSGSLFWITLRRPSLRCGPLGPCCLRLRLQLRGRAGGAQNFCSSACLQSCSWTLSSRTRSVCRRTPLV